jgi:GMP synthase (glutamine-hydrolysing)
MRVVLIRHDSAPEDDRVQTWLVRNGIAFETRRPFAGEELLSPDEDVVASVIFGGRFEAFAYDRYPFLKSEASWIESCISRQIPLLGICQGAQQIAHVLGAQVGPLPAGTCEFGYYEVQPTREGQSLLPGSMHFTQSHFHTFEIPKGATRLASSALFSNQAFSFPGGVFGFQFHAEVTPAGFRRWQESATNYGRPGAQSRTEQDRLMSIHDQAQQQWFFRFLDRFFGPPVG